MNINSKKRLIITIISLFLCIICVLFLLKDNPQHPNETELNIVEEELKTKINDNQDAEIIIKNIILKEIEKHKGLQVIINARESKIIHTDNKIECKNISCSLHDKDKQIAELTSNQAIINKETKNILLMGNTTVHFDDLIIEGQDIMYDYSNQQLTTNKRTFYKHPNFQFSSPKSKINLKKGEIQMSGGIKSEFFGFK